MATTHRAYIGLGANLGEPAAQIEAALTRLQREPDVRFVARSRLYRSAPIGASGQSDYCNAACIVETALEPLQLLRYLQRIEQSAGRVRSEVHWGPRVLDLDLLHVEGVQASEPELTLPHPHLHERNFVLMPLLEIEPTLQIDGIRDLRERAERLGWAGLSLWSAD